MMSNADLTALEVETMGESSGHCDCCGNESRCVWGMVHQHGGPSVAAYWMHWAVGHLGEPGANLDLVLGEWGDGTGPNDRLGVALIHRQLEDTTPSLMVIDADDRFADVDLVARRAPRRDVIGSPLAKQVFSIVDAIYLQDSRFF
ncbi:hypothetical protein [Erythrobacter crassostreae]|uniref:Uncharacterized protein n=1 Tax=Erythrobacter crassostreae TaxID=2828328 RepID=A0A9X1JMA6_9SPHN|nr:hypothetical protein [Erythrobacter crassostrea]MBV7259209.1 hypothetical protein [Erythrobacter crassostrea]